VRRGGPQCTIAILEESVAPLNDRLLRSSTGVSQLGSRAPTRTRAALDYLVTAGKVLYIALLLRPNRDYPRRPTTIPHFPAGWTASHPRCNS